MSRRLLALFAAGALFVSVGAGAAPLAGEQKAAIDRFVTQFTELAMFDGVVLIDIGGEIVYEQAFGRASYEFDVPHTRTTRFRIASVSKSVTDAAVARLVRQGRLSRDASLARFLPAFPSGDRITIGHLLDNRSGIAHTNRLPWGDGSQSLTLDEIVARLAALPLDFEPGERTSYSNGGYAVLAKVLEVAGGGSYAEVLQRTVFGPLGMADSGHIADARRPIAGMATGYEPGMVPGTRRQARFYAVETRPGGGSLYSTAPDLLRFLRAIFREEFVSPDLQRSVMGFDDDGYLSEGRSPGFVAKLMYQPERDLIVVSLANSYAVPAGWAAALADMASGEIDGSPWPELVPAAPTVPEDDPRIGRYRSSFGDFELEIARSAAGHLLTIDDVNNAQAALVPLADGAYLQPQYFQRCVQAPETRVITCRMLSGDARYTSTLTPVPALPASAANADDTSRLAQSREIVTEFGGRLKQALLAAIEEGGPAAAVAVCKDIAPAIAAELSRRHGARVSRTSLRVRNAANLATPWQAAALRDFDARAATGEAVPEYVERTPEGQDRYLKAIPTGGLCLACHGTAIDDEVRRQLDADYPHDRARGYAVGDIRGAFSVVWPAGDVD